MRQWFQKCQNDDLMATARREEIRNIGHCFKETEQDEICCHSFLEGTRACRVSMSHLQVSDVKKTKFY